jgi:hypothetical protein
VWLSPRPRESTVSLVQRSQCGFASLRGERARCHDSGPRSAHPGPAAPGARSLPPAPTSPTPLCVRTPPPPAVGRGWACCLTSVRGSVDGGGAKHQAVAAAAAGGERCRRGLRLARGALSGEARRRRGRAGGLVADRRRLPATRLNMGSAEDAVKEKLLWNVKKEVKSGQRPRDLRTTRAAQGAERSAPTRDASARDPAWARRGRGPGPAAAPAPLTWGQRPFALGT